jgi:hypothetical protein
MARWYTNTPEVKYPNLFFEVSCSLQYLLEGYKIEHTKAEIVLLRSSVIKGLEKAGVTQQSYNLKNIKTNDYWVIEDAINFEINRFYNTNHSLANLNKNKQL